MKKDWNQITRTTRGRYFFHDESHEKEEIFFFPFQIKWKCGDFSLEIFLFSRGFLLTFWAQERLGGLVLVGLEPAPKFKLKTLLIALSLRALALSPPATISVTKTRRKKLSLSLTAEATTESRAIITNQWRVDIAPSHSLSPSSNTNQRGFGKKKKKNKLTHMNISSFNQFCSVWFVLKSTYSAFDWFYL